MRGQMAHLDPEVLAEFDAGLITGHRGARIGAHLAACEACTALGEQLAGVSALLTAVPAAAMPDRVAERLNIALAAEVAHRDQTAGAQAQPAGAQPAGAGARPGGDGSRHRGRRPWSARHWNLRPVALRVLAPAAAVALLAAGGYALSLGSSTSSQGASAAAAPASSPSPTNLAGAAAGASVVPSKNRAAAPIVAAPTAKSNRMSAATFPVVTGNVNFLPATFRQQVETALREPDKAQVTHDSSAAVRACVLAVAGSASPVLVESAYYQGQPATLIVLRGGSGEVALVAGSRCSAADHDVLDRTTVPSGISGP